MNDKNGAPTRRHSPNAWHVAPCNYPAEPACICAETREMGTQQTIATDTYNEEK